MNIEFKNFLDIISDKSGGNKKIAQIDFQSDGRFPIIDQGKDFIAGFTNDESTLLKSTDLPVIIFGDHTKVIKFVDFPFAMGADGVKVLKVSDECEPRYIYHYLKSVRLTDAGYSRHFKFLKEIKIPLPSLSEQKRIAEILDKADELRQQCQDSIKLYDDLLNSYFLKMFTEEKTVTVKVSDLLKTEKSIRTGPFGSQLLHSEFVDEGVAVFGIDNAVKNHFSWGKPRFITQEKYQQLKRYTVQPKDVIITIMGTCGRCAVVPENIPLSINTKHLCCITLDELKCNPEYLHSYFLTHPTSINYLRSRAKGAIMSGLNMNIIKDLPVELLSIETQNKFSDIKKEIEKQKQTLLKQLNQQENLFQSLQQRAFNGEL